MRAMWVPVPSALVAIFRVLIVTSREAPALDAVQARCHALNESPRGIARPGCAVLAPPGLRQEFWSRILNRVIYLARSIANSTAHFVLRGSTVGSVQKA